MAFLIPDNLKSRQDVPAGIRRAASAFEIGLDETAVVWYEPLYDPKGEKPHLVVMLPERGIAVLEVVDAKATNILGFLKGKPQFTRDGEVLSDPLDRANKLAELLTKRLKAESRIAHLGLAVSAGVCLVNLTTEEAKQIGVTKVYPSEFCIYKDEIDAAIRGTGQSLLMRAFTRILGEPAMDAASEDVEKILRGLIQPDLVIGTADGGSEPLQIFQRPNSDDDVLRVMDRQQEAMAKSLGEGHRVIRGVAGSGKTLILVFRAKLIAECSPDKKILVTCYTKTLASQLKTLLKKYPNIDVTHLSALMTDVCKRAKIKRTKASEDPQYYEKLPQQALEGLSKTSEPRYDVVLMDEAQDFNTDEIKFACGLLKENCEDLVIVADAAQNIFKRKFSWKQAGVKAQGRTRILRVNYRNTREILDFASKFLLRSQILSADEVPDFEDENSVIPPEAAHRTGAKPDVETVTDVMAEVSRTVELVREWLKQVPANGKIAVLYPGAEKKDRGYFLNKMLLEAGVDVYYVNKKWDHSAKAGLATASQRVILSTIHSAKGLEFPYVLLCGICKDKQDAEQNRKLAYVGMTRATEKLTVITHAGHDLFSDLKAAHEGASALR